ncbi:period circadian protein homolog 2 isoform X1 [Esox lucius]|uniref:Period circadian protein homolog 2 n=1 Tax=Esox lucius TaxID=8010 RepID=A0A3P8ZLK6_ESOLU|nr:period circadian protein homolog 2 isoform X1 [Esox lucius]
MSGDTDSKPYLYSNMESPDEAPGCSSMPRVTSASSSIPRGATGCSSMPQLHCMSGYRQGGQDLGLVSEGSDSSGQDPSASPHSRRKGTRSRPLHEDVEMKSSGSSGSESHGNESHGNDSHGDGSHGNGSAGSSNGNSKDSALLESSGSNKSSNSHSPSPPSSSNAFSLLSSEHDNPSTSGCSSEESAKAKTQKELLRTLKELKRHLPTDKRNKGNKSTSLNTLKYALRCVKQVEANEEYYQLLMTNDSQPSGLEVSSYTIEEIDRITSEYTLKNNDIFAVAVSLITGKIIYISEQAASILNCKRGVFKDTKFVEFLTPQDVSVFYSFTTPYRLPSWSMCTGAESSPSDCMQEKSFFCRISGGKECEGDLQYLPFRMTPYLMKVQDKVQSEDQFCCLLLAERVHSGYEAPRIPTDKRIFTTTHTPSCVFQDVDERAVPLLGYLPQDLIGTQVLLLMHPSDRPVMLAIHRKIIQFAGQPFDHSSIRFCARNGEYVIVDTSWSSFVNPWSHKVSFVIGRHKVRMGPVNEDVFAVQLPALVDTKTVDSEVQEITEQIHRLLLQPVHNTGSSGYGSTGSNDHIAASLVMNGENNARSSSDNNFNSSGNSPKWTHTEEGGSWAKPQRSFQEICKGIHLQKSQSQEQPSYQPSQPSTKQPETRKNPGKFLQRSPPVVRPKDSAVFAPPLSRRDSEVSAAPVEEHSSRPEELLIFNNQAVYSYQQISCLDSVIRYLEGCNVPVTMKRKCHSSDNTTSSDEDRQNGGDSHMLTSEDSAQLKAKPGQTPLDDFAADKKTQAATSAAEAVGSSLAPLGVPPCSKAESVVSVTSQCSYSSTIVHVGDKKPQPESEIIEDVSGAGETVEGSSQTHGPPPGAVSPPSLEREPFKKMGLTKQVLAAHTQKEEQAFLCRFRGVQSFQASCSQYLELQKEQGTSDALPAVRLCKPAEPSARRSGRNKKTRSKRVKQNESSDSSVSHDRIQQQYRAPLLNQGLNHTCWSTSNTSQSTCPSLAYPTVLPAFPLQVYPRASAMAAAMPTQPENSMAGFVDSQCNQDPQCPLTNIQPSLFPTPMVTPMVALVLPNYVFPQMGAGAPGQQPFYQAESAGYPPQLQPFPVQTPAAFTSQGPFPPQGQPFSLQTTLPMPTQGPFPAHASFTVQAHGNATGPSPFFPQAGYPIPTQPFSVSMEPPKPSGETAQSRSSTPRSTGGRDQVSSPPLFQSRCSSPLQLNLLQLEETRGSLERQDSMVVAPPAGTQGNNNAAEKGGCLVGQAMEKIKELQQPTFSLTGPMGPLCSNKLCVCKRMSWDRVGTRLRCCSDEVNSPGDSNQSDANSSSSDLLDILLHSDSHSGTSSATSGSMGSRSNGCGISARTSNSRTSNNSGTSGCRTAASGTSASAGSGSGTGSSSLNSSNYFGSVDSSLNSSQKGKGHSSGSNRSISEVLPMELEPSQHDKYVLQEPPWLATANADEKIMLTYQMPSRDIESVLREDRERLHMMQKSQPCFTGEQKNELVDVHPWMRKGGLPKVIDITSCVCCCEGAPEVPASEEQPDLDMGDIETETGEVCPSRMPSKKPFITEICPSPCSSSGLGSS